MTRLFLSIVLLAVSCAPVAPPASAQRYVMYQYAVAVPTKPVSPNERLKLVWEPRLASKTSDLFEVQLCVALFGPWESVEALKRAAQPDSAPGFYDLLQISIFGPGNSTSAGSVIEVR